jgi:hypothetical protein
VVLIAFWASDSCVEGSEKSSLKDARDVLEGCRSVLATARQRNILPSKAVAAVRGVYQLKTVIVELGLGTTCMQPEVGQ